MVTHEWSYPEQAVLKENFYRIAVRDKHQWLKAESSVKLRICRGNQLIMIIRGDRPYSKPSNAPKLCGHLLKVSVINIVEEVLSGAALADAVELEEDGFLAVLNVNDTWIRETVLLLAKRIQQSLLWFLNYSVSIGISNQMNCFAQFYTCYSQSIAALEQKFYRGPGCVHFYANDQNQLAAKSALLVKENEISAELETFAFEKVRSNVIACIERIKSDEACPPGEFKAAFIGWVLPWLQLYKKYGASQKKAPLQPFSPFEQIHELETLDDFLSWYGDFTHHLEKLIRQGFKGLRTRDEIKKAKRYIAAHYAQDISIREVAGQIGLNSAYFSHLFKKEIGQGFTEFLTRHRLTEAQRLLRETAKPIGEISDEVGYNDVTYFRKLFRQQLQMTPSEYRAQFTS
ncbi:AraC family transcriptional regulator [Paenibacillus pasadenensis]|uniref:helix-turn-helix domain-containing protein n=1 Tax=Paenibacillus pasadenensis TaxID=217090 RepID=UPI00203FB288|nr:AraC family transcriptional regulator [Paenibacillus pasadenensis]MCM3745912.1 AraC family transcriptional regulator [Paenibacillus pasadenensis]